LSEGKLTLIDCPLGIRVFFIILSVFNSPGPDGKEFKKNAS